MKLAATLTAFQITVLGSFGEEKKPLSNSYSSVQFYVVEEQVLFH